MNPDFLLLNFSYSVNLLVLLIRDILWFRMFLITAQLFMLTYAFLMQKNTIIVWNLLFFLINSFQVVKLISERKSLKIPDELLFFYEKVFPSMTTKEFLSFWNAAKNEESENLPLCYEGETMNELILILEGTVVVIAGEQQVATLSRGQFVAEMSFMSGKPASATVKARGLVKFKIWNDEILDAMKANNHMLLIKLQESLGKDLVTKLVAST